MAIVSAILEVVIWISVLPLRLLPCLLLDPLPPDEPEAEDLDFLLGGAADIAFLTAGAALIGVDDTVVKEPWLTADRFVESRVPGEARLPMLRALGNCAGGICLGSACARANKFAELMGCVDGWTRGCDVAKDGLTWVEVASCM